MAPTPRRPAHLDPRWQVAATWTWNLVGTFAVAAAIRLLIPEDISIDRPALQHRPSLTLIPIVSEIVLVGLLPVVFAVLQRDRPDRFGVTTRNLTVSSAWGAGIVLLYYAASSVRSGGLTTGISWPGFHSVSVGSIALALAGLFAYGPLEIFYVVWLIRTTDRIFGSEATTWSPGLLITVACYGVLHVFSQGAYSLVLAALMLAFGLVFKRTHNSVGPMIAFLLINDYPWFLASALLG